ncbi:AzlC family ABC transporter permease [Dickeya lacustris]|uniref:AzlC family ABC transporter permease n=1 Tax=Dickeya lacustris TaxID=2259638 RepID=A0ABY8G565_9GAMM|nr:AzlC family ABC transporter permease [Dickeya lacustris]WFN55087.1 AzlC family ABC transporter permease [Dickeya lacustris]
MKSPSSNPASPASATEASFAGGVFDSLPIVIGYVPVAFAFGLNAVKLGFTPLEAIFLSCIIYAGASQFVITALLSAGASLWVAALTVMAMDIRHVLYGPSLRQRITQRLPTGKTPWWAFGLTDEVFAAATAKLSRRHSGWSEAWMLGVALCAWLSWVVGTVLGAHFGNGPLAAFPAVESALAFMLPALFLSFLLSSFRRHQRLVVAAALGGALLGLLASSIPAAILTGIGCGCLASLMPQRTEREASS